MDQQEQATKRAAIFQDTINGTNDPTPWPVAMWAAAGDTIWTGGTARTWGEDSVGMYYGPGDIIVHRNNIVGDVTRANESFAVKPTDGRNPMDAMLAGIEQWNHQRPDQWDTVPTPGDYRMTDPTTGRPLPMGWSDSLAMAASAAGRLDPELLQASLMQAAAEREPRPCVFFQEDNGYDLMVFSWHRNPQGLFDAVSFKHLQYDDLSMQVTTISHSEDMEESFPAKAMSDGELLTQSRALLSEYQTWREQDGGPVCQGMTGRIMRSGLLKPGLEQKPLLNLNDGRRAPDWDAFIDAAAVAVLQGRPISPMPALPRQEQPGRDDGPEPIRERSTPEQAAAARGRAWPNAWVANRLAHTYILHAKDGRDWPKMIVGLPRGTTIDGKDLTGWATDLFMSEKNQNQKNEGRAVNLRFRPNTPVELFTGRARPGDHRCAGTQPRRRGNARRGIGGTRGEDGRGGPAAGRTHARTVRGIPSHRHLQAGCRAEMGPPPRRSDGRTGRSPVDQPATPAGGTTAHPGAQRRGKGRDHQRPGRPAGPVGNRPFTGRGNQKAGGRPDRAGIPCTADD